MIAENAHPAPLQRFQERDTKTDEVRYASWYPDEVGGRTTWSLCAYTIRRGSYPQLMFASDDAEHLPWALTT